jgi:hypothetical protein
MKFFIWGFFENPSKNSRFIKIWQYWRYFTWKLKYIKTKYRWILLRMRKFFWKKTCTENQKTHFMFNVFMSERGKIWYSQIDHWRQYNMAHALCMLDNWGYRRAFTICNTYCFSVATMVTRNLTIVALYVYCLCCLFWYCPIWNAVLNYTKALHCSIYSPACEWIRLPFRVNGTNITATYWQKSGFDYVV